MSAHEHHQCQNVPTGSVSGSQVLKIGVLNGGSTFLLVDRQKNRFMREKQREQYHAKKNNWSPIETITEIPMVSIKIPL